MVCVILAQGYMKDNGSQAGRYTGICRQAQLLGGSPDVTISIETHENKQLLIKKVGEFTVVVAAENDGR